MKFHQTILISHSHLYCICLLFHGSRQSLLDHITVQLAPRAADEIWFGEDQVWKPLIFYFSLSLDQGYHLSLLEDVYDQFIFVVIAQTYEVKIFLVLPIFQLSTIWAETADNARSAARTFVLGGLSDKHYGVSNFWVAERINVIESFYTIPLENKFQSLSSLFMWEWKEELVSVFSLKVIDDCTSFRNIHVKFKFSGTWYRGIEDCQHVLRTRKRGKHVDSFISMWFIFLLNFLRLLPT